MNRIAGHAAASGTSKSGQHEQGRDHQADHQTHDAAGELGCGLATELALHAADRAEREPADDPAHDETAGRTQEDEGEGPAGALGRHGATEQEPAGAEHGDEDQPDTLDQAPSNGARRRRSRFALAHRIPASIVSDGRSAGGQAERALTGGSSARVDGR